MASECWILVYWTNTSTLLTANFFCNYSLLNEFTGLDLAARNACVLTIATAKSNAINPVIGKIHQAMSVRTG